MWRRIASIVLSVAYPFLVWAGLQYFGLNALIVLITLLCLINLFLRPSRINGLFFVIVLCLGAASFLSEVSLPLKLYPVAVNGVLLCTFAFSLMNPPSVIERLARLKDKNLPDKAIAYTRKLTIIWCCFFIANGLIALWTALAATDEIWALYNGFIAYVLIGLLLGGEVIVRRFFIASDQN